MRIRSFFAAALAAALLCPADIPAAEPIRPGAVVVVPIQGQVSKAQFLYLRRALKDAERDKASAFLLEMDTYGGDLHAAVDMVDALGRTSLPTLVWINRNAGSAGALIALGTRSIYMSPVSAIGAAAPVMGSGEDLSETMNDKVISYFSKYFRSAAERNGHNPDLAEAFINKNKEVKIGDKVVSEKGSLLTLSAQEAVAVIDGRPVLAAGIGASIPEVLKLAVLGGEVARVDPTGFEQLAIWITALAPLFLLGGIAGAYIEFKTPGFGVPGALSMVCFAIFFAGHYLAGLAGFEAVGLFVLGLVFLLVELFFLPGVVVFGLAGVALIVASVLWAMVDYYPGQPALPDFEAFYGPLTNLGIAVGLAAVLLALLARYFPQLPLFRHLMLQSASAAGPVVALEEVRSGAPLAAGQVGIAETTLRPAGKARFGDRLADVVTEDTFLPPGTPVVVERVEGMRVVVGEKAES
jgi:membrane-bound serine protease (ClpP class)